MSPLTRCARRAFAALLMSIALGAPAGAQSESGLTVPSMSPIQEAAARSAMEQLRSPVTPSHTVDMCPSVGAMRDSIRVAAASGWTSSQIVEDVIARHGEQLRLVPKKSGTGLLAWLATPLVLLVGAALITRRLRQARADAERFPVAASTISDADRDRVAAALRQYEQGGEVER